MKIFFYDIKHLWRDKAAFRISVCYLACFVLLVIFLPLLPLPYAPNQLHLDRVYLPPFQWSSDHSHFFGTDALGRDVFSNTVAGARTAFLISFPVVLLTALLGVSAGVCAGFFGDTDFKVTRAQLLTGFMVGCAILYMGLYVPLNAASLLPGNALIYSSFGTLLLLLLLLRLFFLVIRKQPALKKEVSLPLDQLLLRLIETFTSIPKLIFILVLSSFLPSTVLLLSVILILTYWTGTARLARAEMLKIRHLPYFESARSIGVSNTRMIYRHALPNMMGPLLVSFTFGLASLLAFESTLSFLGIGVPGTLASWGRMIAGIRHNTSAWWLIAFPGSFLILTVFALQICSYYFLASQQQKK